MRPTAQASSTSFAPCESSISSAAIPQAAIRVMPIRFGSGYLSRWADFLDLTKPRMNALVVITAVVGYFLAARGGPVNWLVLLDTLIGTALTAGAASAFNQFMERQYDALMPRTRRRPLPAGKVHPLEALYFAIALAVVGMFYLAAFVNLLTAVLGTATLLAYVLLYTPMKRTSTLCTIVGAVPGAIPPVMGFTACQGALSLEAVSLFAILFLWQMPHFLAIAVLYRDDYAAAGFKMLPVVDSGLHITGRQIIVYTLALAVASFMPVQLRMAGTPYLAAAVGLGAIFLGYGIACATRRTREAARRLFVVSILYLPLLLAMLMLDAR